MRTPSTIVGLVAVAAGCGAGGASPTARTVASVTPVAPTSAEPSAPCGAKMALVPAASVALGEPRRPAVQIDAFCMDVTELTVADYGACVAAGKCPEREHPNCTARRPRQPMTCIEQEDAAAFCASRGGRLPTPDEWEYAARGPGDRLYPWGDERPGDRACWGDLAEPSEVGTHPADRSPFGILDLAGNVSEWTNGNATEPVSRGGSYRDQHPARLRITEVERWPAHHKTTNIGARCVSAPKR